MRTRSLFAVVSTAWLLVGCMTPPSPAERITDAAMALNVAARFNQLDVEVASLSLPESDRAVVLVDYAWIRNTEGTMRATRVEQHWKDDAGWHLVREKRMAGDVGLFGEPEPAAAPRAPDKQFATRTIHE